MISTPFICGFLVGSLNSYFLKRNTKICIHSMTKAFLITVSPLLLSSIFINIPTFFLGLWFILLAYLIYLVVILGTFSSQKVINQKKSYKKRLSISKQPFSFSIYFNLLCESDRPIETEILYENQ